MKKWLPFLIVSLLPDMVFCAGDAPAQASRLFGNPMSVMRHVQYSFTLQNTKGDLLPCAEFWTLAPVPKTATQKEQGLKSSQAYSVVDDNIGNRILGFTVKDLPPYGVKIITIEADLSLADLPAPAREKDLASYLKPEPFVEIDNPEFAKLAPCFAPGEPDELARKIYDWEREYIQDSTYSAKDSGALYALKRRKGDCSEYAYLFVALCRFNHIPARSVGGYRCRNNTVFRPSDYHQWAEFYSRGTWHLVDPQVGYFMTNASQYVAMRILGESKSALEGLARFRCQGDGLKATMN